MNMIEVGSENSSPIYLHYEDLGAGKPVILLHGWPLNHQSWEMQVPELIARGHRVITYCRRGFGDSSKPSTGYNYDTFAEDLHKVITHLDLREVTLVGFSMGTGEVARYLATYGDERISRAAFISGILPALLKDDDNPEGVDGKVFDSMIDGIKKDRFAFMKNFFSDFYGHGLINISEVSEEVKAFSWNVACQASPIATVGCIESWFEDFRSDISKIKVPCLVIHGSGDKVTPLKNTGLRLKQMLPRCRYVELDGAPHGLIVSHAKEVNASLIEFLRQDSLRYDEAVVVPH